MHHPLIHWNSEATPPVCPRARRTIRVNAGTRAALLIIAAAWGLPAHALPARAAALHADPPAVAAAPSPPPDLRQLDPWLDYKRQGRIPALPAEARIFYRQGMLAFQSKSSDEALRLVRGAVELDPTFLAARVTLFRWSLTADPSQALAQASGLADLVRRDFATQWSLAANAAYLFANAWMTALLLAGLLLLVAHNAELRHGIRERLGLWTTPASSRTWAWVIVVAPFLLGYGIALPVVAGLGLLWPVLRARERAVWVMLFASLVMLPFAATAFNRLALPMRAESTLATVLRLDHEAWTRERDEEIARLSEDHFTDPFARFGAGWMELKAGDPVAAETAYRDVLRAWSEDDRALDNLGTALMQQGRQPEALAAYQRAVAANPRNAIAYFNLSQAHLVSFEFAQSTRALATASALDFDRVREYKNQPASNGALDPVPDWVSPRRQWEALSSPMAMGPLALPPSWQGRAETTPPNFAWVALIVGAAAVMLGRMLNRRLPLLRCTNCERVVCRRCAERRRAQAMCTACARVARGAASPDFARILLSRERERSTRVLRGVRMAMALAVPGAGLLATRQVWRALLLMLPAAAVLTVPPGATWPYAARARIGMAIDPRYLDVLIPLALIYGLSLWWYFAEQAKTARRLAELMRPTRPRPRVSARAQDTETAYEAA